MSEIIGSETTGSETESRVTGGSARLEARTETAEANRALTRN